MNLTNELSFPDTRDRMSGVKLRALVLLSKRSAQTVLLIQDGGALGRVLVHSLSKTVAHLQHTCKRGWFKKSKLPVDLVRVCLSLHLRKYSQYYSVT